MKLITHVATIALTAVAATSVLKAGEATGKDVKAPVVVAPASPLFTFTASENYDSRYMFRGIDVLAGTGILSTSFTPTWHITSKDTLSVPVWFGTAVKQNANASAYRELDVPVNYLHTFDSGFAVGAGYELYTYINLPGGNRPGGTGIQNEVNVTGSYTKTLFGIPVTGGLTYYYELGTANQYKYGSINPGSSFLTPRCRLRSLSISSRKTGRSHSILTLSTTSPSLTMRISRASMYPVVTTGSSSSL